MKALEVFQLSSVGISLCTISKYYTKKKSFVDNDYYHYLLCNEFAGVLYPFSKLYQSRQLHWSSFSKLMICLYKNIIRHKIRKFFLAQHPVN